MGTGIELLEQSERVVPLLPEDAEFLSKALKFVVIPFSGSAADQTFFSVNPEQWVGHFTLPSGSIVRITPKIPTATVLRMLAYAFLRWHEPFLRPEEVEYETDSLLFEPLVRLFNELVTARTRKGLVQDYVRHEENLTVVRGKFIFREHIQKNAGYPNRAFCRFFENTVDVPDNQIICRTLRVLLSNSPWTRRTEHDLIANLHQFEAVSDVYPRSLHLGVHHYHRLNEDYAVIHQLCALFLASSSISESVGSFPFKGFLLDMNKLFEKFVEQAFVTVGKRLRLDIRAQKQELLADGDFVATIQPDIIVSSFGTIKAIVDAKYKRDAVGPQNSDIFQVVAYGTALRCLNTYLVYPETELAPEGTMQVRNSQIVVNTKRFAVSGADCVEAAEECVRIVLQKVARTETVSPVGTVRTWGDYGRDSSRAASLSDSSLFSTKAFTEISDCGSKLR